jgi:hypothetical protein
MLNIDNEIRSQTEAFASDLAELVRRAALESVSAALRGGAVVSVPVEVAAKRGPGRPKKAIPASPVPQTPVLAAKTAAAVKASKAPAKAAPPFKAPISKKAAPPKRASGEKRPPAELAKLTERLGEYIKGHPGLRMEAIGKALGAPTKDLNLPMKKLLAAKKVRSEGQKRATEYYAA